MPKSTSRKKIKKDNRKRHDPLEKQILTSMETGTFKATNVAKKKTKDVQMDEGFVSDKMSKKIMDAAQEQQTAMSEMQGGKKKKKKKMLEKKGLDADDDELNEELAAADDDEQEELEITEADENELNLFMPASQPSRRTLADIIMEKIAEKQGLAAGEKMNDKEEALSKLDPKLVEMYGQVGIYLSRYHSGKIPKAFKIIPSLKNWEEVLFITNPEKWTAQSFFAATRLFASNLNEKMAQRYFNMVLLPKLREDIEVTKRLNYHLYNSVMKAVFKPAAFFRGLLLPLAQDGCTAREALIMSSILSKISIPVLHSSVALLKLAQMPYSGPCTLFMKTLLNKKYSLPYRVMDALVKYFMSFHDDSRKMPVIWHQNVLMFVQRYKNDLSEGQKNQLRALMRKQTHPSITAEIRRELFAQAPLDLTKPRASIDSSMDMS